MSEQNLLEEAGIEEDKGNPLQAEKFFPGPEDYGSGTAIIDMIKTTIRDWPLKLNLLRLLYITNIKNFISEFWNLENDDDPDLIGMSQRVKDDLKVKAKYVDDYVMESLERSLQNVEPDIRNKIKSLFDNMSVSAWPIMNLYYFYINLSKLVDIEKLFAMKNTYKEEFKKKFTELSNGKDKELLNNIMYMKDQINSNMKDQINNMMKNIQNKPSTNEIEKKSTDNKVMTNKGGRRKKRNTRRKHKKRNTRRKHKKRNTRRKRKKTKKN